MSYDYREAMYNDIKDTLEEYKYLFEPHVRDGLLDADGVMDDLRDALFVDDSVTGNGSGSYTFNSKEAGEYVGQNWDLLVDAVEAFDTEIPKGVEAADVTIRCYLLDSVLWDVIRDVTEGYRRPEWLQEMIEDSKEKEEAI